MKLQTLEKVEQETKEEEGQEKKEEEEEKEDVEEEEDAMEEMLCTPNCPRSPPESFLSANSSAGSEMKLSSAEMPTTRLAPGNTSCTLSTGADHRR